jgi:hypothetical protein
VALGANQAMVLGLVLREGIALIAFGVLCGSAAAFAISRLIGKLLYQVSPADPLAFLGFSGVMSLSPCLHSTFRLDAPRGWTLSSRYDRNESWVGSLFITQGYYRTHHHRSTRRDDAGYQRNHGKERGRSGER